MTVVGVAPATFAGVEVGVPADLWAPESMLTRAFHDPLDLTYYDALVGRLRRGVTLQQAESRLEGVWPPALHAAADLVTTSRPQLRDDILALQLDVASAAQGFSESGHRYSYRRPLALLLLSSLITVVLSCVNLSGLLLARWSTREADLAVQAALGASNGRLVSQVLGESLALTAVAVVLSTPLAIWSAKAVTTLLWNNPDVTSPLDLRPDYRVLGVMVALAGLVALCVSVLPASRIWFSKLTLTRGTRSVPGRSVVRWGRWLSAAQVALSVPLVVTAWIVAANLTRLEGVNRGFQKDGITVALTSPLGNIDRPQDPVTYLTQLAAALRSNVGVESVALTWNEPASFNADFRRRAVTAFDGAQEARPFVIPVSPGYFGTLNVPFVAGRDFAWTEDGRQPDVAIISSSVASVLFPNVNPVGRRVRMAGQPARVLEVVGVVADANLAEPHADNQLILFTAMLQVSVPSLRIATPEVLLRSSLSQTQVEALTRRTVAGLGRDELYEAHALSHTLAAVLMRERVMRLGAFYFAGLTTFLVFVGSFVVLHLGVVRRIPEIGLRLALGASTRDIRVTVVREAFTTAAVGLGVGLPCALAVGRLVASSLTLADAHDPRAFAAAIVLTLVIATVSVLAPLRRAARVTPLEALRQVD